LALLFSEVDSGAKLASSGGLDHVKGLVNVAENSRVVLRESNGFWKFSKSIGI